MDTPSDPSPPYAVWGHRGSRDGSKEGGASGGITSSLGEGGWASIPRPVSAQSIQTKWVWVNYKNEGANRKPLAPHVPVTDQGPLWVLTSLGLSLHVFLP